MIATLGTTIGRPGGRPRKGSGVASTMAEAVVTRELRPPQAPASRAPQPRGIGSEGRQQDHVGDILDVSIVMLATTIGALVGPWRKSCGAATTRDEGALIGWI